MNIGEATLSYKRWLARSLPADAPLDLDAIAYKDEAMKESAFPFLRATFYRWAQQWQNEAGDLAKAPRVLAVGDLHVENFGTWRDRDQNWIWGINDFDEAWELPWTSDLVRLGVSASLAVKEGGVDLSTKDLCASLLRGYGAGLMISSGAPFNLAQAPKRLIDLVEKAADLGKKSKSGKTSKAEEKFWKNFDEADTKWQPAPSIPKGARQALESALPPGAEILEFRKQSGPYSKEGRKPAGLGSLGRQRYAMIFQDSAGRQMRETKVTLPSAVTWAAKLPGEEIKISALLSNARRFPDPYFAVKGAWAVRRIAPDAVKIGFEKLEKDGIGAEDLMILFESMGRETANIHLGSSTYPDVLADLTKRADRDVEWYVNAVKHWREQVRDDLDRWQKIEPED
jgi:uncharacterized protein (DUF2252 family)